MWESIKYPFYSVCFLIHFDIQLPFYVYDIDEVDSPYLRCCLPTELTAIAVMSPYEYLPLIKKIAGFYGCFYTICLCQQNRQVYLVVEFLLNKYLFDVSYN